MKSFTRQLFSFKKFFRMLAFAIIPAVLFFTVSLKFLRHEGFDIVEILRDPAQQTGTSSFIGFLSNMGVWLWISTAAICLFSVVTGKFISGKRYRELLFLTGMLSLMLATDDFFLLHDRYINQKICYLVYALFALSILIRHYRTIIEVDIVAFLTAGLLLALSILTDLTQNINPIGYRFAQVFEEAFKFTGAATWLYFNCILASYRPARL